MTALFKGKRHILFVAAALMIVAFVILHLVFARSIYKAGGFSVKNPFSYVMVSGFLLLAAFKLKYLRRFKSGIGKYFKGQKILVEGCCEITERNVLRNSILHLRALEAQPNTLQRPNY
jgi:hypothetical protein